METASYWVKKLDLRSHPEGGFYKEIYRCPKKTDSTPQRSLATSIYFLLEGENISRFHRLSSDELWYFHAGTPTIVHTIDQAGIYDRLLVGNKEGYRPQAIIPAGTIFAAEVEDKRSYSLLGCMVTPGFDFEDFELMERQALTAAYPSHKELIKMFT